MSLQDGNNNWSKVVLIDDRITANGNDHEVDMEETDDLTINPLKSTSWI